MGWGPLLLLIVGLSLAIAGWFCDRLNNFPTLERLLAKRARDAIDALNLLATNNRHELFPAHPGFSVIVAAWPGLSGDANVAVIGRSVAYVQFGPTVENHFELIARSIENAELPPRWRYATAIELFKGQIAKRVFWLGAVIFWVGIAVSLAAGLLEHLSKA